MIYPVNQQHSNYYPQINGKNRTEGLIKNSSDKVSFSTMLGKDSVQISAEGTPVITEAGRNSTGKHILTDAEKQYLKQKYDVSDQDDSRSLLVKLTNMGALSYQDYKLTKLCKVPGKPITVRLGQTDVLKKLSRNNAAEFYREMLLGEVEAKKEAQEAGQSGEEYAPDIAAKSNIYNLMKSLLPEGESALLDSLK